MKQFAIRRLYSYYETTSKEIEEGAFDETLERVDAEISAILDKYGLKTIETDTRFIPL